MSESFMNPVDFNTFKLQLLELIESEQRLWAFKEQIGRLISHAESEQRISVSHGKDIDELKGAVLDTNSTVGLRTWRRETEDLIRELKWMLRAVVTAIIGLIGNVVWTALTRH